MATQAQLWAFAADGRLEQTFRRGLDGRDAVEIRRGSLSDAVRALAKAPSPKLVFVELDGEAEPRDAYARLRSVCAFGTEFIAVGSNETTSFARSLLHAGFADYLAKPVTVADMRDACATLLDDLPRRDYAGRVVTFAGSGGCGVSSLIAGLVQEGRTRDLNSVILSLDPVFSEAFGLEPSADLSELLLELEDGRTLDFDPFERPINGDGSRVALVAHLREDVLSVTPSIETARALVRQLANRASMVALGGIPDPELLADLMTLSDVRVVMFEPNLVSINVAVRTLALLGADHPAILLQCHRRARKSSLTSAQIRYALGDREPDVVMPYDPALDRHAPRFGDPWKGSRRYRKALDRAVDLIFERIQ